MGFDLSAFDLPSTRLALTFLPVAIPIGIWVAWSDMRAMKIPNMAVMAMALSWLVLGWIAVPLEQWLWGFALMGIVLVCTFIGNMIGLFGAGDAKFAAAMAPVFVGGDVGLIATLYMTCSIAALVAHRVLRAIPAVQTMLPDWKSLTSRKFPMGLALAGMLIFYLLAAFLPQG